MRDHTALLSNDLPAQWRSAILVGRLQLTEGPVPIVVVEGRVRDVSCYAPTVSALLAEWAGVPPPGVDMGRLDEMPLGR